MHLIPFKYLAVCPCLDIDFARKPLGGDKGCVVVPEIVVPPPSVELEDLAVRLTMEVADETERIAVLVISPGPAWFRSGGIVGGVPENRLLQRVHVIRPVKLPSR